MADVIDRLGDDSDSVNSIFISVDPERDKEEVIKNYVSAFHEEIIGLTGSEEQISNVAKDWGVYYQKEDIEGSDDYTVNHLDIIFLANANGEYVDFFPPKIQSALIVEKVRNIINKN
jgi:protein SCO1/2